MELETIESKLEVARQKKATGDTAFKAGDWTEGRWHPWSDPQPFFDYTMA